jgi:AraC-like DNA-binding protein
MSILPLSAYRVITTSDPDVALHGMRQRQPCCRDIVALTAQGWNLVSNAYRMGDVTLVASVSQGYSVEVHPDQHIRVFMPLSGNMGLRFRGHDFDQLGRAEAFFLNHDLGVTTFHPGNSLVLLTASGEGVSRYLRLLESDIDPTLLADQLAGNGATPGLDRLRRTVLHTIWEIDEGFPELGGQDLFKTQKEQILLLQLASVMASLSVSEAQRPSVYARTLRRAMEYVRATPADSFSYEDLAKHVGASLRSVQMAFRAGLGMTIRDWLKDYRLDLAREALRQVDDSDSVTMIALHCGFPHVGRFSAAYFARFGEYPSETARQHRWRS